MQIPKPGHVFAVSSLFLSSAPPHYHYHHRPHHQAWCRLLPLPSQGLNLILHLQSLCGHREALSLRSLPCTRPASYPAGRWGFQRIHVRLPRQGWTFTDMKSRVPLWLKTKSLPPKTGKKSFKGGRDQQNETGKWDWGSLPRLLEMRGGN